MKTLEQITPYIITAIFIYAMSSLFVAFVGYVERNGL